MLRIVDAAQRGVVKLAPVVRHGCFVGHDQFDIVFIPGAPSAPSKVRGQQWPRPAAHHPRRHHGRGRAHQHWPRSMSLLIEFFMRPLFLPRYPWLHARHLFGALFYLCCEQISDVKCRVKDVLVYFLKLE